MRASSNRHKQVQRRRLLGGRGAKGLICAIASLLLFVSVVTPARQQLQKRRKLGEDNALSAALNGLPVSPSAGSGMSGVNVYGLDSNLLAALQGNGTNGTSSSSPSSSQGPAGAPASQPMRAAPPVQAQFAFGQPLKSSTIATAPGLAMAPQPSASPPRSNVTPLDPLLAAALENQTRASAPAVATGALYGKLAPAIAPASIPSPSEAPLAVSAAPEPSSAGAQQEPVCSIPAWQAASLKLLHEKAFASLFLDSTWQTVFDPTGLEHVNNIYYVVFNSTQGIAYVPNRMATLDYDNKLIGIANNTDKTTWGGIAHRNDDGAFLAVQERRLSNSSTGELRPVIQELNMMGDLKNYTVARRCHVAFNLSQRVTGFQDIQFHTNSSGARFVLGLCDGNHCESGQAGRDRGNGRIVVAVFEEFSPPRNHCHWVPQKVISIPATAAFTSYAGLAIRGDLLLISSKSDSQIWIGSINWDTWEFVDQGALFNLPRNDACEVTYCNIGAVQWLDDRRITLASGVAQPGDPWPCHSKSESLHQFLLPVSAARPVAESS